MARSVLSLLKYEFYNNTVRTTYLGRRVDSKLQFALLAVVHTQSLQKKGCEPRSGTATKGVEDEESLESGTLISQFSDPVQAVVNNLLSDGVVTTSVVVGSVLFATDELFGVEELSVGSSPHFINNSGLQVEEDSTGNVLASSSLAEEGVESVITHPYSFIRRHLTIRLDTVLQTVQFPAGITDLTPGLSKMNRDTLTLKNYSLLLLLYC